MDSCEQTKQTQWATGVLLATLPVISFSAQYLLSEQAGTVREFFRHYTVAYVDWLFVPFNFLVARVVNWRHGKMLFGLFIAAVLLNLAAYANWQEQDLDGGHMIAHSGAVLPAGWVHLGFAIVEMSIVLAFIFAPRIDTSHSTSATVIAVIYFVAAGISGYAMHGRLLVTDFLMVASGILLLLFRSVCTARRTPQERKTKGT